MNVKTGKLTVAAILVFALAQIAFAQSEKHLSPSESIAAAVSKPQPEYSPIAKQLKLEGAVSMNAWVSEDGDVERVEQISGNPVLGHAAEEALKHWKFNKQTEDGKPIRFVASVTFTFKPL